MTASATTSRTWWSASWTGLRRELWVLLELLVLCGFAIGQPLFDVTGRSPEFFVFRHVGAAKMLLMVAVVTLVPAAVLWLLEMISGLLGERVRRAVHLAVVTGLLGLLALEVLKKVTPLRGKRLALLALLAACAVALLYARRPVIRQWLRYLAPAPLVFALLFITVSPASKLILPQREGAANVQVASKTPVIMVLFDEFPLQSLLDHTGKVDSRLFPNFARLAGGSTWYRNATGVSGLTTNAVPAVLTGQYPTKSKVPLYSAYPDSLFTLLGRSYDLKVLESVTRLCPPDLCSGSEGSVERAATLPTLLRDVSDVWAKIVSPRTVPEDVTTQFGEATASGGAAGGGPPAPKVQFGVVMNNKPVRWGDFIESIRAPSGPSARPPLHFIHMMLPHPPWYYLPSGRSYPFGLDTFGLHQGRTWETNSWTTEPWPVQVAHQRHLLQLVYTDALIGQLLDRLKAQGLYNKSLVVVTADHGNSFTPGQPRRILTGRNASELMWVPLFVKAPGQTRGAVDDRNWEHVDLLPTMASILGVRVPWHVDGLSQTGAPARRRGQKYFYNSPGERSVVAGPPNQALALRGVTDRVGKPALGPAGLFDVTPDPSDVTLLGRPLSAMRIGAGSGQSAVLDHPEPFAHVDLAKASVPAHVSGALRPQGRTRAPLKLVFAVNGTIGAVGETFQERDDAMKFAAMVPDSLFKQGANQLRLFVLESTGATPVLHPVALGGGASS